MSTETRPITIDHYLAMIADGLIPLDARLELLDGRLVQTMTKYPPHNYTSRQVGILFKTILTANYLISEEKSLALGRFWRPEPDLAIVRGPNERYRLADPKGEDVVLLIEVADSSYPTDRGEKWRAYAAARIPIYWIVNLSKGQVEVYTQPAGRGQNAAYRESATFGPEAEVRVIIDGQDVGRISVKEILP